MDGLRYVVLRGPLAPQELQSRVEPPGGQEVGDPRAIGLGRAELVHQLPGSLEAAVAAESTDEGPDHPAGDGAIAYAFELTEVGLGVVEAALAAEALHLDAGGDRAEVATGGDVGEDGVGEVEDGGLDKGVEQDVVGEGVEVEALETHAGEELEGELGFAGDGVADDEGLVEAGVWRGGVRGEEKGVAGGGREEAEPVEDDGDEVGAGEAAEDGVVGGAGVAVAGLAARPVEEAEAEEEERGGGRGDDGVGAVAEGLEHEGLGKGDAQVVKGGVKGGLVGGAGEGSVDSVEQREGFGAEAEPVFHGGDNQGRIEVRVRVRDCFGV